MAPPKFLQDARCCFRNFFRLSRYSEYDPLRTLATHMGVLWFVVRFWRRRDLWIILGMLLGTVVIFLYNWRESTPSNTAHFVIAWIVFAGSLVLTLKRFLNLHRFHAFGDDQTQHHTLSSRFFMEPPPDGSDPEHATISDIVGVKTGDTDEVSIDSENIPILTVGNDDRPVNRAAVDLRIARALLETQTITTEAADDGSLFHGNRHDIMALTARTVKSEQIDALQIMRREALWSRTSFFDSPKIALKELRVGSDGTLSCKVGRTSYFVTSLTNDLSIKCLAFTDGKVKDLSLIKGLFPAIQLKKGTSTHPDRPRHTYALRRLDECQHLSNHVGSVVLAVSSDNIPVLCFQGQGSRINSSKVVLSGAGSIDLDDLDYSGCENDLASAIRYGMARELLEETGLVPQDSNRHCDREELRRYAKDIQLAGYYRDLRRGGLPIFIGFCRMKHDFQRITSRQYIHPYLFRSSAETRVVSHLPRETIAKASDMRSYLESRIRGTATFRCDPSDQLMLIREMLALEVIEQHFNRAIQ